MTPTPTSISVIIACGLIIRPIACNNKKPADPAINRAWPIPDKASALPCPNRCSLSAGCSACLTATKLITDANTSKLESNNVAIILTESVINQAIILAIIRTIAVVTEA